MMSIRRAEVSDVLMSIVARAKCEPARRGDDERSVTPEIRIDPAETPQPTVDTYLCVLLYSRLRL